MAPKSRKARREIYDCIYSHGRQNKIFSCKIRLTTANFEPCFKPEIGTSLEMLGTRLKNLQARRK